MSPIAILIQTKHFVCLNTWLLCTRLQKMSLQNIQYEFLPSLLILPISFALSLISRDRENEIENKKASELVWITFIFSFQLCVTMSATNLLTINTVFLFFVSLLSDWVLKATGRTQRETQTHFLSKETISQTLLNVFFSNIPCGQKDTFRAQIVRGAV